MECFGAFSLLNIAPLPLGLCKYDHSGVVECYLVKFLPASIAVCASIINRASVEIVCLGTRITHISLDVGRLAILRLRVRHCVFRLVYLATQRKGSLFLCFLACHGVWSSTSWSRVLIASAVCCVFLPPLTRYPFWSSWYWTLGYKGPVPEEKRIGTTYFLFRKCSADWNLLLDSTGASARFILRQGVLINTRVRCGLCAGGGSLLVDAYFVMVVLIGIPSASDILGSLDSVFRYGFAKWAVGNTIAALSKFDWLAIGVV